MIPTSQVQATVTSRTAPERELSCGSPEFVRECQQKGQPNCDAPCLRGRDPGGALNSAQHGPTMSSPIKMTRDPSNASATVMSNIMTMLNFQKTRRVFSVTEVKQSVGTTKTLSGAT